MKELDVQRINGENLGLPINIQDHILRETRHHPEKAIALSSTLTRLTRVAKSVSRLVNTAGLHDLYGKTGNINAYGDSVIKLDERANEQFKLVLERDPYVAGYASEEEREIVSFGNSPDRKYVLWLDPLDGSSNFDTNVSIGSIFSIYKRVSPEGGPVTKEDFLQKGREQICAGYFLYGASTMLVYTAGYGVYAFTLDPEGEFVLPPGSEQIQIPKDGNIYSVNEAYSNKWSPELRSYTELLKTKKFTSRYIGSLVADLHRNFQKGGIFLYPADSDHPTGKLRYGCEAASLAFLAEQAGGAATDGVNNILDIKPMSLQQTTPLVIGSENEVKRFQDITKAHRK